VSGAETGSLIALLSGVSGTLFGALLGGLVTLGVGWLNNRRERRLNTSLALFAEFHSPGFNAIRIQAYDVLERSRGRSFDAVYEAASLDERAALSSILHYFEKVALLLKFGAVDRRLITRFLRQYANWWRLLLCPDGSAAFSHPEWGATLRDVDWLFGQLKGR
jgi:hypothetical protein